MKDISEIVNLNQDSPLTHVKKGEIIQRPGDIASKVYYVKSGLFKSYTIDEKGKEHVFMFAPEGWIVADIEAQEFETEAKLFIEALENSQILSIERSQLRIDGLSNLQLQKHVDLLSRRIGILQQRVIALMSASAKDRYESFLKTYPNLSHRLSQRMIASYIGITPEALSKIRAERVKK